MIQFFVDNNEIVLPEEFSFTWTENNPELTSDGEFSLDITISLLIAKNAIAFKFLNRLNKTEVIKKADAYMIDNGIKHSGTIVVSKNDNVSVTFQFLAGNSELKYIASTSKKIFEMDWGTESEISFARALDSVNNWDWRNKFVCTPIKAGSLVLNEYNLDMTAITDDLIVMQPFLLYYLNKLPELLGYQLSNNVLESDARAQRMYIVNPVSSLNYADCLPDMSISEFIKTIEDFFNVVFVVSPGTKTMSIVRTKTNLVNKKTVNIVPLDDYSRELLNEATAFRFGYTKISYDFPGTKYYAFHRLADDIVAKCTIREFFQVWPEDYDADKLVIYRDTSVDRDWVNSLTDHEFPGQKAMLPGEGQVYYSYQMNKFADFGSSNESVLSLKLIPSAIYKGSQNGIDYADGNSTFPVNYLMAESSNEHFIPTSQNIFELIEGTEKTISRQNVLEVSMYAGRFKIVKSLTGSHSGTLIRNYVNYPFSITDDPGYEETVQYYDIIDPVPAFKTMRLVGPGSVISDYQTENILDMSKKYIFLFVDSPELNPNNIFIINNLKYIPIYFEKEKSNNPTLVTGQFYRMLNQ